MSKWAHISRTNRGENVQAPLTFKKSIWSNIMGENWVLRFLPLQWAILKKNFFITKISKTFNFVGWKKKFLVLSHGIALKQHLKFTTRQKFINTLLTPLLKTMLFHTFLQSWNLSKSLHRRGFKRPNFTPKCVNLNKKIATK